MTMKFNNCFDSANLKLLIDQPKNSKLSNKNIILYCVRAHIKWHLLWPTHGHGLVVLFGMGF